MCICFVHKNRISPHVGLTADLNVATESVVPPSIVTVGLSCSVFEISPWDRQQTGGR